MVDRTEVVMIRGLRAALDGNCTYGNISDSLRGTDDDCFKDSYNYTDSQPTSDLNVTDDNSSACFYYDLMIQKGGDHVLVAVLVFIFFALFAVCVGLVTNSLNIAVFSSREMINQSSNVYLLSLACSDTMFLLSLLLSRVLNTLRCTYLHHEAMDIYNTSLTACKLLQYLLDLFSDYSATLILAFTTERFIACYFPVDFKKMCTVRRAVGVSLGLLGVIALTTAPYHFLFMGHKEGYKVCTILERYAYQFFYFYIAEVRDFFLLLLLKLLITIPYFHVYQYRT